MAFNCPNGRPAFSAVVIHRVPPAPTEASFSTAPQPSGNEETVNHSVACVMVSSPLSLCLCCHVCSSYQGCQLGMLNCVTAGFGVRELVIRVRGAPRTGIRYGVGRVRMGSVSAQREAQMGTARGLV